MNVNVGNRVLWTLIGLILLGLGVLGTLMSLGRLPGANRNAPLLAPGLLAQWRQSAGWLTMALVLAGLVLAILGFLLLRAQLRPRGGPAMPDLVLTSSRPDSDGDPAGRTRVHTGALTRGLSRDLLAVPGVRHASANLSGNSRRPDLLIRLTVDPAADLDLAHREVDQALRRFTTTSGLDLASVEVDTKLTDRVPERVH
jgi:hypothetical protein